MNRPPPQSPPPPICMQILCIWINFLDWNEKWHMEGKWFYRNITAVAALPSWKASCSQNSHPLYLRSRRGFSPLPCPPLAPGTKPWAITRAICRGVPKFSKSGVGLFNTKSLPRCMFFRFLSRGPNCIYCIHTHLAWSGLCTLVLKGLRSVC